MLIHDPRGNHMMCHHALCGPYLVLPHAVWQLILNKVYYLSKCIFTQDYKDIYRFGLIKVKLGQIGRHFEF